MASYFDLKNKIKSGNVAQSKTGYFAMKEKVSPIIEATRERDKEENKIKKYEQAQQESALKLEEFRKTQGGIKGAIGKFLGFGVELPKLVAETPEYTAEREASKPKSFGQNVKDLFTEATTQSIYDTFYQQGVDETNLKTIESNNRAINQLAEKNKNEKNEEAKARRQKLINDIYAQNKSVAEDVGGEIAKKTNKQLVGQSLMTALELTPFLGLKEAGTTALKLGIKGAAKGVGKETVKKIAGEAAGFGAATGLASGLEQEGATLGSIAKSTAIGGAAGGVLGFGLGKLGQLFAKKATQRAEQSVIKNIEKKLGKLDTDESDIVREAVTSGTDEAVITKQIEDVRKSLDEIYPETKVETPKAETPEVKPVESPPRQETGKFNSADEVYDKLGFTEGAKETIIPVKSNGNIIGGIDASVKRGHPDTLQIHHIRILPEAQGKGAGTEAVAKLFKNNPKIKILEGHATAESKSFWKKQGAKFSGPENNIFTIKRSESQPLKERVTPKVEGTGEVKTRGLAKGIESKAVEKKLTEGFKDLPEYKTVNIKDQASKASELVTKDLEKAKRIALGEELPPKDILPESVLIAVEEDALKKGDVDTLRQLATSSNLVSEATTMGQRLRTLAERNPDSVISNIQKVAKDRISSFEKRTGKIASKAKSEVVSEIKSKIKQKVPTKDDWNKFITDITC